MPKKIVLNRCYGGFGLSNQAHALYKEATKDVERSKNFYIDEDVSRDDPILIQIIEEMGVSAASGLYSKLEIIEIPDDAGDWTIMEYDGVEWVAEKHRTWGRC